MPAFLESVDTRPRMRDLSDRSYDWYRPGWMSEAHRESGFSVAGLYGSSLCWLAGSWLYNYRHSPSNRCPATRV